MRDTRARDTPVSPRSTETYVGKVAVVTGASRGIGRAIATELAARGSRVALLARSKNELEIVARQIEDRGGVALVTRADVSTIDEVTEAVRTIDRTFGRVDILVNNAGVIWPLAPTITIDPADWAKAIAINLIGVVTVTLSVLPTMLNLGWGRVVNVSSSRAGRPAGLTGGNAYATSKAGLEAHTVNLAEELAGTGVTVNAYRPGSVETSMHEWIREQPPGQIGEALHTRFVGMHKEGKLIPPQESAEYLLKRVLCDETGQIWDITSDSAQRP